MAKRKRLSPLGTLSAEAPVSHTQARRAPIADVAADASASAALNELASEMEAARANGRLAQALPLEAIEVGHLLRDRIAPEGEDEDMAALIASIRARGQQAPIDVADLGAGHEGPRYGLISGWRRLSALKALHAETGQAAYATVLAVLRRPDAASEAYVAMVEENELRVGLSYYERARVAARAAEVGVFADPAAAIRALFATASKAKRSKILSFAQIYQALDGALAFPAALPERLGLNLARALAESTKAAAVIGKALAQAKPADAAAEQAVLAQAIAQLTAGAKSAKPKAATQSASETGSGIQIRAGKAGLTLSGPGVDAAFRKALERWVSDYGQ